MYKVIIADDEDLIREGLKTFVDWSGMGFFIDGEAANGSKAYDLVVERLPHVLLTDIKMPISTGVELMEKIRGSGLDVRIVVLSGYDEFEYARAALDAGARGYLLKPIKFDKLREVLSRVKAELDAEAVELSRKKYADRLLRHDLIRQLAEGKSAVPEEAVRRSGELGMPLAGKRCGILLAEIDDAAEWAHRYPQEERDVLLHRLHQTAAKACDETGDGGSEGGIAVYDFPHDERTAGFLFAGDRLGKEALSAAASRLLQQVRESLPFHVTIATGDVVDNAADLHASYAAALRVVERKFFLGGNRVITSEELPHDLSATASASSGTAASAAVSPPWQAERLIALMQSGDTAQLREYVRSAFGDRTTKSDALELYARFMRLAADFLHKNALSLPGSFAQAEPGYLRQFDTMQDLLRKIDDLVAAIADEVNAVGFKRKNHTIQEVKSYIDCRYADNLSLETAAQHIHVHPMYLSKIFKKETGINFIEYLTDVRVARAKQFLADARLKIYEVSDKVGYNDPKHFSKVFKAAVGVTPYEYRKVVLGYLDDTTGS